MRKMLDILRERLPSETTITPELEETCEALDASCPNLLSHILESETWLKELPEESLEFVRNRERAEALAPKSSGCCWFRDPVTGEIPLSTENEWMIRSLDPSVWLPFFQAFPTLAPEILAGPLTDVVALRVSDNYKGRAFLRNAKNFGRNVESLFRLRKGEHTWLCFTCPRRDEGWSLHPSGVSTVKSFAGAEAEVEVMGLGSLIPIPNTVTFLSPEKAMSGMICEHVVLLKNEAGDKPEMTPVPDCLMGAFADGVEGDARRIARLYRRGPASRERLRELVNNAVKALTAFPEGPLRDRACREACRPVLREMRQVLGDEGMKSLASRLVEDAGITSSTAKNSIDKFIQDCPVTHMLLALLVFCHAGNIS